MTFLSSSVPWKYDCSDQTFVQPAGLICTLLQHDHINDVDTVTTVCHYGRHCCGLGSAHGGTLTISSSCMQTLSASLPNLNTSTLSSVLLIAPSTSFFVVRRGNTYAISLVPRPHLVRGVVWARDQYAITHCFALLDRSKVRCNAIGCNGLRCFQTFGGRGIRYNYNTTRHNTCTTFNMDGKPLRSWRNKRKKSLYVSRTTCVHNFDGREVLCCFVCFQLEHTIILQSEEAEAGFIFKKLPRVEDSEALPANQQTSVSSKSKLLQGCISHGVVFTTRSRRKQDSLLQEQRSKLLTKPLLLMSLLKSLLMSLRRTQETKVCRQEQVSFTLSL